ncbi:phage tail protein [Anaeromusa acidaminophila]|uniref:phage tail protein n=1 Tax=Anaeromusa acidaminophila TaxID=81464 RepID=UPI0009FEB734
MGRYLIESSQGSVSTVPTGTIIWFASSAPPEGFLECNGQPTAAYPALAILVGPNVPDLRGEFIRGWDHGKGIDSGRSFKSWQTDMFQSHTHTFTTYGDVSNPAPNKVGAAKGDVNAYMTTNATGGTETRPRNIALLPCIKY